MSEKPCELAVRMASAPIVIRGTSIFSTLPFSLPVAPGAQACVIEVDLGLGEARTCAVCMVHHFLWCVLGAWSPCNSNSELSAVGHTCFFGLTPQPCYFTSYLREFFFLDIMLALWAKVVGRK